MNNKIQNICSATGWFAKYKIKNKFYLTPVTCWAWTKSGKIEGVLIDGKEFEFATQDKSFVEYVHESTLDKK